MQSFSRRFVSHHHIELAKYVKWPLLVSIIGPEQRGPAPRCNLPSIWSEKPVPNHLGDEKASILRPPESLGTVMCLGGTVIGALMTRGNGTLASCGSIAGGLAVSKDPDTSPDEISPESCCPGAGSASSGLRLTTVPLRMCFGGLLRAFFLLCLADGDEPPAAVGDSLQPGDFGL